MATSSRNDYAVAASAGAFSVGPSSNTFVRDDLRDARRVLCDPAGLSFFERMNLWWHGVRDARKGMAYIDETGKFRSVFIEKLERDCNAKIIAEWQECDGRMIDVESCLRQELRRRDLLSNRLTMILGKREEALDRVRSQVHAGDACASEYLAQKRQRRREDEAVSGFDVEQERIANEISSLDIRILPLLQDYRNAEDIARIHELAIRNDYLRRVAVYAYGASRYVKVTPAMIDDSSLTSAPAEKHEELFRGRVAELDDSIAQTGKDDNGSL